MGSPLAPVLANLFMGHHERIWLQQYDGPEIYFYRRYVDDTFCLFNNETDALEFFHYINDKHPNITFTMETEVNHKLPFLDVLLDNSNPPSLVTSVFRKSTYTGLLTNFLSFSPFPYKLGLIRTLVDRTFKIGRYKSRTGSTRTASPGRINSDRLGSSRIVSEYEKKHKIKES